MKNVTDLAFQGDIMIRKVEKLPEGVEKAKDNIVAHSETGHHHVAVGGNVAKFASDDPMVSFLVADGNVELQHLRSFDTHETLNLLNDGDGEVVWEIRRQREHTPDGWRRVED